MERDRETGLLLVGIRETKPIRIGYVRKGPSQRLICDVDTGRPLNDVLSLEYAVGPHGESLVLTLMPTALSLDISNVDGVAIVPDTQLVDVSRDGKPYQLKDGEVIHVTDREGRHIAALTVQLPQPLPNGNAPPLGGPGDGPQAEGLVPNGPPTGQSQASGPAGQQPTSTAQAGPSRPRLIVP